MLTLYLTLTIPILIIDILLLVILRKRIKDACVYQYDSSDCREIKNVVAISLIVSLVPIFNLIIFAFWIYLCYDECKNSPVVVYTISILRNAWDKFVDIVSKPFIG